MTLKADFGKKLKNLREALFMSQEVFAEKIGVHRNTLARIENGSNFVSYETLEKIQEVLNIEYKDLFNFEKTEQKDPYKAFVLKLKELNEADIEYFLSNIENYLKAKEKNQKNN